MENYRQESAERASVKRHRERRYDAEEYAYRAGSTDGLHFRRSSSEHLPPLR